jgi:hypothetical protein
VRNYLNLTTCINVITLANQTSIPFDDTIEGRQYPCTKGVLHCLISKFNQMFSVDTILLLLYKMLYLKGDCKSSKGCSFLSFSFLMTQSHHILRGKNSSDLDHSFFKLDEVLGFEYDLQTCKNMHLDHSFFNLDEVRGWNRTYKHAKSIYVRSSTHILHFYAWYIRLSRATSSTRAKEVAQELKYEATGTQVRKQHAIK